MNSEKKLEWVTTLARVGNLSEQLRILRQSKGITAGEKKAIAALMDKLGRFNQYGLNCCVGANGQDARSPGKGGAK